MQRTVYQCDMCGTEQQQTNHWFSVHLFKGSNQFIIGPLKDQRSNDGGQVFHLCGDACVIRKVSEYLSSFSARQPETERAEP